MVIAVLREKGLPAMRERADHRERQLDQHPPDSPTVAISRAEDVFLHSSNWARWQLRIPLPTD